MTDTPPNPNPVTRRHEAVICPRCGYHFKGILATWTTSCPVDGQCSECGLSFRWWEIFVGDHVPKWYVEFSRGFWSGLRRTPGTFWRVILGSEPSGRLRLEMFKERMRFRPFLGWFVLLFLVAYLGAGLAVGIEGAINHLETIKAGMPYKNIALQIFLGGLVDPFAILPEVGGKAMEYSLFQHISMMGIGSINYMGQDIFWVERSGRLLPMPVSIQLVLLAMSTVVTPLVFMVLPYTRREAKVRLGHLARLAFLSVAILVLFWLLLVLFWVLEAGFLFLPPVDTGILRGFLFPIVMLRFVTWWSAACKRFLRFSSWQMVAASVLSIGLLTPVAVVATFNAKLFVYGASW
ncbi:MAG: hypothetical protein MK085_05135 [Phycisphaerales bacterium]|nr:hypothetical protein [Phycisphaerales bacterium]